MKFYKLKKNNDLLKFDSLEFLDDLNLKKEFKNRLVEYLKSLIEEYDSKNDKEFMSIISEHLNIDNDKNIGNTIDIYTTNKKIYQMCYLEDSKDDINFLGTISNTKRKLINGDVFIFVNSLSTTKIDQKDKTLDYIKQENMSIDDLIEVILSNYFFTGLFFDGNNYGKFKFDNHLKILAPKQYHNIELKTLTLKRSDILNFKIDVFYDNDSNINKIKDKFNKKLGMFYLENFKNRIFIGIKSDNEKNYDSILDDYIQAIMNIYEKKIFDDDELRIPRELKYYDYQDNKKYTNKYIVFDNLYEKLI